MTSTKVFATCLAFGLTAALPGCAWFKSLGSPSPTAAPTPAPEATPPSAPAKTHVEVELADSPGVAFRLAFYTGSIDDPPGKEGLTALTARLMAQGGTQGLTYPQLLAELYPMSARVEVSVDTEQTVFSGFVHRDHAEDFARLLGSVICAPRLGLNDFQRIRSNLVDDIVKRLRANDDENLGKAMLQLMMYGPEHPYGHHVGGTVEGLESITLKDVRAHARRVFGRQRLVVGLAGRVDDAVRHAMKRGLDPLTDGEPRIASIPEASPPARMKVLIADKPGKAVAISMGHPHQVTRSHPDFLPLALVQSYFGEHRQFHGVLMQQMRGIRGLNYGDYAYVENFIQESYGRLARTNIARRRQHFEIWIRPVDPKDAVFSIRLAMYFLARLVDDGLEQRDVDAVATFLGGYSRLWDLTPSRKLGHAIDDVFYGQQGRLASFRTGVKDLKADVVNAAVRAHLNKRPLYVAIVAPDAAALRDALVSGAPSAKTYEGKVDDAVLAEDEKVGVFDLGIRPEDVVVVPVERLFNRKDRVEDLRTRTPDARP